MKKTFVVLGLFLFLAAASANAQVKKDYPAGVSPKDRVTGAIMGVLIGDALGVGCHWYYDLSILHEDFGPWISGYLDPKTESKNNFAPVAKQRYKVGEYNRCARCGRPRAYYRKFGICRICLREVAHQGVIPGLTKSSW